MSRSSLALFFIAFFCLCLWSGPIRAQQTDSSCSFNRDCPLEAECVGAEGICQLPSEWSGPRVIPCTKRRHCRRRVNRQSRCIIERRGTCQKIRDFCGRDDDCPPSQHCVKGLCSIDNVPVGCSVRNPCPFGQSCCSDGSCSESCSTCSRSNLSGTCPLGLECRRNGRCRPKSCFNRQECPIGFDCRDGLCDQRQDSIGFPGRDECSVDNPGGQCAPGFQCQDGRCVILDECSATNWNGFCPRPTEICHNGVCVARAMQCSRNNLQGFCPPGESCLRGRCEASREDQISCSAFNACPQGQMCADGVCEVVCSTFFPDGYCQVGRICQNGQCVRDDNSCSRTNPNGNCPRPQVCVNGRCIRDEFCSRDDDCPRNQLCQNGECIRQRETCSRLNPNGYCPGSQTCDNGRCIQEQFCNRDRDCFADQVCHNGRCIRADDDTDQDPDDTNGCSRLNPCPPDQFCNNGRCQVDLICFIDTDCPRNQFCQNGRCHDDNVNDISSCQADQDCPEPLVCQGRTCVPPDPVDPAHACQKDDDCSTFEECQRGQCVQTSTFIAVCSSSRDCPSAEVCQNGRCVPDPRQCSPFNHGGTCFDFQSTCVDGQCVKKCSRQYSDGYCPNGLVCDRGTCSRPCSTPCGTGQVCQDNECVTEDYDTNRPCNRFNRCPDGRVCRRGLCVPRRFLGQQDGSVIHIPDILPGGITISVGKK